MFCFSVSMVKILHSLCSCVFVWETVHTTVKNFQEPNFVLPTKPLFFLNFSIYFDHSNEMLLHCEIAILWVACINLTSLYRGKRKIQGLSWQLTIHLSIILTPMLLVVSSFCQDCMLFFKKKLWAFLLLISVF
jgi:hypothetical protein